MKKFLVLPLVAALALFVSCQKQQTEEEKKAEVERQVQERLATERQADEAKRLAQQKADLEAREKALADNEAAALATPAEEPVVASTEETTTRETSETVSETASTESYGTFYEKLEPYGAWRETTDYGYVWQPREAEESQGWRPYTEGRWAYSDVGWTWISDEPFGWATYHYGRWLRLRRVGWVWVPGNEWAPAWVSWRSNKDYVGWAPLPPEARFDRRHGIHNWADNYYDIGPDQYAFVRGEEFGSQHLRRSVVSAEQNVTIVNETTNVTNITFANMTVVNQGPSYEELRTRSRQPLERYRLRRHSDMNAETRSATIRGDEIQITVPLLSNVSGFHRPRSIKERVSDVVIDTGWTAIADRSAAERTRTKMRSEATAPPNAPPKKFVKPAETSSSPAVTATAAAATTPAATPATAATATPAPIATIAPTVRPSATVAFSPSQSPRVRPSPAMTPRATLAPAASPSPASTLVPTASPSFSARATLAPTASASPAPTRVPTASPSISVAPVSPSSTVRMRPSPSVPVRASPSIAPIAEPSAAEKADMPRKPEDARKPRPMPRPPAPAATINPESPAAENTPPQQPRRKISPIEVNTPAATAPPSSTRELAVKPAPTFAPPVNRPVVPPRVTPVATQQASEPPPAAVAPVAPAKRLPPRITPPVTNTPPTVTSPGAPPIAPPARDDKPKDKKPKPPGPLDGEIVTPPPTPSPAPK